jgi:hypothetical protein
MEITGLSMAAHAHAVVDRAEAERILQMIPLKYPKQVSMPGPMPKPEDVRILWNFGTVEFPFPELPAADGR